jgi:hypothetical protein
MEDNWQGNLRSSLLYLHEAVFFHKWRDEQTQVTSHLDAIRGLRRDEFTVRFTATGILRSHFQAFGTEGHSITGKIVLSGQQDGEDQWVCQDRGFSHEFDVKQPVIAHNVWCHT